MTLTVTMTEDDIREACAAWLRSKGYTLEGAGVSIVTGIDRADRPGEVDRATVKATARVTERTDPNVSRK